MANYSKVITKKNLKVFTILFTVISIFIIVGLLSRGVRAEQVKDFLVSFGILSPIIFMLLSIVTIVISPLIVTPIWIAGIKLFGFSTTLIYNIIANIIGHSFNFQISRKYGRPLVKQIVGEKGIKEVDKFAEVVGRRLLIFLRIIGGPAADYISYGTGFTNMNFLHYTIITSIFMLPWTVFSFWMTYKAVEDESLSSLVKYFALLAILTIMVSFIVSIIITKRKNNLDKKKKSK